jgi:hypothetical protein
MISHNTVKRTSYYSIKTLQSYRMIPNHNATFIPSSHKSKNSVAVETGFLHSKKFTKSHHNFLVTVESATFQVLCQRTKPTIYFNWSHPDVFHLILKSKVRQKHNNCLLLNI